MLLRLIRNLLSPSPTAVHFKTLEEGKAAFHAGRHVEAEAHFRKMLALSPVDPEALFLLGVSLHGQRRLDEAWRCCSRGFALRPAQQAWRDSLLHLSKDIGKLEGPDICRGWVASHNDFAAHLGLGNALREAGALDEARTAYEAALRLEPDSMFGWRRLGGLLAAQECYEEADACFRKSESGGLQPDGLVRLSAAFFEQLESSSLNVLASIAMPRIESWAGGSGPLLLMSGDAIYLRKFAHALTRSALQNGGIVCRFHVHAVNPDSQTASDVERIRSELCAAVGYTWESLDSAGEYARTYFACARWLQLPRLMKEYADTILVLDLDQIVTGDLRRLLDAVAGADIGLIRWHANRWEPWEHFSGSVAVVSASPGARAFVERAAAYAQEILRDGKPAWFLDQMALYVAHAIHRTGRYPVSIALIPPELHGVAGTLADQPAPGAVLWTLTYSAHAGAELPEPFLPYLPAADQLVLARRGYKEGDFNRAEELFRMALQATPMDTRARFELGVCCHAQGRLEEALQLCHEAWETQPANASWADSVKHISIDIGKAEGVDFWVSRCAAVDDFVTKVGLGNALREAGRLAEAKAAYEGALASRPESPFAARRLASLLAVMGDLERADALYRQSARSGLWPDAAMHLSADFFAALEERGEALPEGIVSMQGSCADAAGRPVVVLSGDTAYLRRFAYQLVNSLRDNAGLECLFHFHVVGPDADIRGELAELSRELGVSTACTWEEPSLPPGGERTYYACARFLRVPQLMAAYDVPLLVLDLDQLVIGSLHRVEEAARGHDLGLLRWHASRWEPWDTYWASAVWYQPVPGGRRFARLAAQYIAWCMAHGAHQWYLDQCAIFCVLARLQSRGEAIDVGLLDPAWACLPGTGTGDPPQDAIFWSVIYSQEHNHAALDHPLFLRYARPVLARPA